MSDEANIPFVPETVTPGELYGLTDAIRYLQVAPSVFYDAVGTGRIKQYRMKHVGGAKTRQRVVIFKDLERFKGELRTNIRRGSGN